MGKRLQETARIQIVKEAMAGVKVGTLSRIYHTHPETIRTWIREYRDSIPTDEVPMTDGYVQELQRLQEVEQRYSKAVQVIGEKELEIEILRELLKKQNPAHVKNLK